LHRACPCRARCDVALPPSAPRTTDDAVFDRRRHGPRDAGVADQVRVQAVADQVLRTDE
jgi:hypothetical protein